MHQYQYVVTDIFESEDKENHGKGALTYYKILCLDIRRYKCTFLVTLMFM